MKFDISDYHTRLATEMLYYCVFSNKNTEKLTCKELTDLLAKIFGYETIKNAGDFINGKYNG